MIWWARKLYRLIMGSIFPLIYYIWPQRWPVMLALSFFLIWALAGEITRKKYPGAWRTILRTRLFGAIFKKEAGKLLGSTYFLVSCLITVIFFSRSIVITAMTYLVFGDAVSTLVGEKYGKIKLFPGKSLEGSLAFLAVCSLLGWILHYPLGLSAGQFLGGAGAAALIELLPLPINDNFTIALFSALIMSLL